MERVGFDENCLGCVLREIIELTNDNYDLNRNKIFEILFNFNSKYNDHRHDVLSKVDELETMIGNDATKEDVFFMIDLIGLKSDFLVRDEMQKLQKLMFESGNSGGVKERHNRMVREFDKTVKAKIVK